AQQAAEKIERNKVFYFDLEDMNLLEVVNKGVEEFIAFLVANGADLKERCFVFIRFSITLSLTTSDKNLDRVAGAFKVQIYKKT
ncbi:unnamed protein product, partial [marine sediment metagenome]